MVHQRLETEWLPLVRQSWLAATAVVPAIVARHDVFLEDIDVVEINRLDKQIFRRIGLFKLVHSPSPPNSGQSR
jgi:hypothetical protein